MCACINRNVCKNIDAEIVEEGDDDEKINVCMCVTMFGIIILFLYGGSYSRGFCELWCRPQARLLTHTGENKF